MSQYKPVAITTLPRIEEKLSEDTLYWKNSLEPSKVVSEYGAINCLDLNSATNDLLVTSLSKVTLYNYKSMAAVRTYNCLTPYSVYGAEFRKSDHKLIISGTEEGKLNLHDVKMPKPLKVLSDNPKNKHLGPVHSCRFFCNHQIVSTSDDKTIKLWDLASGALINDIGSDDTIKPHGDYVRTCCVDSELQTIISGSYDHTVKVWDPREGDAKPIRCMNLTDPVESVICHNSYIIAASSRNIHVFDMISGTTYKTLDNIHSKTVTCLCSRDKFLLSGSLDGQIKIFDRFFNYVNSVSYFPVNILSLAVDAKCLAVGANDGSVFSRLFKSTESEAELKLPEYESSKKKRYFQWIRDETEEQSKRFEEDEETIVVGNMKSEPKQALKNYDRRLKKMQSSKSLEDALRERRPQVVVSLMQELIRRGTLSSALAGRTDRSLARISRFIIKYVRDPKYSRVLIDVASVLTEIYADKIYHSTRLQQIFSELNQKLKKECDLMKSMKVTAGALAMMIANTTGRAEESL